MRQIISSLVIVLFTAIFLGIAAAEMQISLSKFAQFQFTAGLYAFMEAAGIGAVFFAILILLTLLIGRWYCGFLCPMGILQDLIIRIRKKRVRRIRYRYFNSRWAFTTTLIFSFGLLIGFSPLVHFLEPYANFGKFINNFIKPLLIYPYDGIVAVLHSVGIYHFDPHTLPRITLLSFSAALILAGLPIIMSWHYGRRYCNLLCPVGGILRIISKFSLIKLQVKESACTHCGLCERECKAEAILSEDMAVAFDQCIHCYRCLDVCSTNALEFKLITANRSRKSTVQTANAGLKDISLDIPDAGKRQFLSRSIAIIAGFTAFVRAQSKEIKVYVRNKIKVERPNPVLPPGALGLANFTEHCIACQLCVSVCPTQVLRPSLRADNSKSLLQPEMDFIFGFCNFNCTLCGDVCPTPAIKDQKKEDKQLIQIGKSKFIKDNCVVYTQKTDCGACAEHCPTKAVRMKPDEEGRIAPSIDEKICVGCGQCEYACPTIPFKAIYVESNIVHVNADKPPEEEPVEIEMDGGFPF